MACCLSRSTLIQEPRHYSVSSSRVGLFSTDLASKTVDNRAEIAKPECRKLYSAIMVWRSTDSNSLGWRLS